MDDRQGDADELVAVQLGADPFAARLVASACEAEGLRVSLMTNDAANRGFSGVEFGNRLLVRRADVTQVEEIIRRSHADPRHRRRRPRP